jgi:hypothetical protein
LGNVLYEVTCCPLDIGGELFKNASPSVVSVLSLANGALGEHRRHDTDGMRLEIAAPGCRSSARKSTEPNCPHAGQENDSHGSPAAMAAPIEVFVKYPGYRGASAYVASRDETNDLARLTTEMNEIGIAKFVMGRRVGQRVATYGFPLSGILSSSGNFTFGKRHVHDRT